MNGRIVEKIQLFWIFHFCFYQTVFFPFLLLGDKIVTTKHVSIVRNLKNKAETDFLILFFFNFLKSDNYSKHSLSFLCLYGNMYTYFFSIMTLHDIASAVLGYWKWAWIKQRESYPHGAASWKWLHRRSQVSYSSALSVSELRNFIGCCSNIAHVFDVLAHATITKSWQNKLFDWEINLKFD